MILYLAGPRSGYELQNFPAFDLAAAKLRGQGHIVRSPADIDRSLGYDPRQGDVVEGDLFQKMFRADVRAIVGLYEGDVEFLSGGPADAVAVLPGWQKSLGAAVEITLALKLGMPILDADTLEPIDAFYDLTVGEDKDEEWQKVAIEVVPDESILQEAQRLVHGDRGDAYGHPADDFSRTAQMWSGLFGIEVHPHQVALAMILLKVSRLCESPGKRDSWVDVAGYAETGDMTIGRLGVPA